MPSISPHGPSVALFLLILASVIVAFVVGIRAAVEAKTTSRTTGVRSAIFAAVGLGAWLLALSAFVQSGMIAARPVPFLMVFFIASNGMALAVGLSPVGRVMAEHTPIWALVAFQSFRLPLEWVLHAWSEQGAIPETMTWTGSNFDVVSGLVAVAFAASARKRPQIAWVVNVVGLVLLANVARVAILSSPLPFAWPLERPLLLATQLPFALIVPVCVAGALFGHVVLTRALLRRGR